MPVLSLPENVLKLWNAWNIRVSIFISLIVQALLIPLATLRKGRTGRKWIFIWVFWFLYLFADWIAIYSIGQIVHGNSSTSDGPTSDIMAFWAPFLLLHLGGPDNITSYALEDNELWKRHWLQLIVQVCFTIYIFLKSFSKNDLWVPASLVLIAGMIKYGQRNTAFYRASFDQFGDDWVAAEETGTGHSIPLIPAQFKDKKDQKNILETAIQLFGCLKRIFVGPLLKEDEQKQIMETLNNETRSSVDVLQIFEIELSLLYEALFTKFPVIVSNTGSCFRVANFVCILVASILFSLVEKKYQLEWVDIMLTYVLLIGALILDCLSHILLIKFSDWYAIAHFQDESEFRNAHRWSKAVSQLNFLTYHVKDCPVWLKGLESIPVIGSLLETIHNLRCQSSQNLKDSLWCFIWKELQEKIKWREDPRNKKEKEKEVWFSEEEFKARIKLDGEQQKSIYNSFFNKLDFTQNLLVWHIGTELCFQDNTDQCCRHECGGNEYRSICKLLSDYMFYLAVVQPSMMAVALDDWKNKFKKTSEDTRKLVPWISFWNEKVVIEEIQKEFLKKKKEIEKEADQKMKIQEENDEILFNAVKLARVLKKQGGGYPWKEMSQVWLELMFFAAIYCKEKVHAQQPSQGGELLTFVWLSINHLGLGFKSKPLGEQMRSSMTDDHRTRVKEKEIEIKEKCDGGFQGWSPEGFGSVWISCSISVDS